MDTLRAPVADVLNRYQHLLDKRTPHLVSAVYVYGSVALDAFVPGRSDIDFVALLSRNAQSSDLHALQHVHHQVAAEFPTCPLEGSYLQAHDLGHAAADIGPYPCYFDGRFHPAAQHDLNPVTWWMMKRHAVVMWASEPQRTLDYDITWAEVRAYMQANLTTYWRPFTTSPRRLLGLLSDADVEWAVLGISRLLYGLQEDDIVSKAAAGEYALTQVPPLWHALIREALLIRIGSAVPHKGLVARITRARQSAAYIPYLIERLTPA
jgi:hypothetical protein